MSGYRYEARYSNGWLKLSDFWYGSMDPRENGGFVHEWNRHEFVQTKQCVYDIDWKTEDYVYREAWSLPTSSTRVSR